MTETLRYLWRRKLRTGLTMVAVVVGILAVTLVGGIAEYLEASIRTLEQDALSRILVMSKDYSTPLGEDTLRQLRRIPGVAAGTLQIQGNLEKPDENQAVRIEINPPSFVGIRSDIPSLDYEPPFPGQRLWAGRTPLPGNRTETVVTWRLAQERNLKIGDTLEVQERTFKVVGIWEDTAQDAGRVAFIDYVAAEDILGEDAFVYLYAIPKGGADLTELVKRIQEEMPEVSAQSPDDLVARSRQQVFIFSAIMGASGVMSLLIGSFTIINTMVVSVQERRREIGLKKALGAEDGHILSEVVVEAMLISGMGGIIGVIGGILAGTLVNQALLASIGTRLFAITPRLALGCICFSLLMGMVSGAYPAWRAARLKPVIALRGIGVEANYAERGLKRLLYLVLRNARTIFTVAGIAIGVFAMAVLGSLTEALNSIMSSVQQGTSTLLLVLPGDQSSLISYAMARNFRTAPGVSDVIFNDNGSFVVEFGGVAQESLSEEELAKNNTTFWAHESESGDMGMAMMTPNTLASGRMYGAHSLDEVVIGAGLAQTHDLALGDKLVVNHRELTVVGIWKRIPFDIMGQDLAAFTSTDAMAYLRGSSTAVSVVSVRVAQPSAVPLLTEWFKREYPQLLVQVPQDILGSIQQVFTIFVAIMVGVFSIAVFVGSVSVINTMVIAVNEQTRAIGLKKAVGAEDADILAEVLMDAGRLGAFGGVIGVIMAWVAAALFNAYMQQQSGISILNVSPRLVLAVIIFSTLLGMFSGIFPARRAARLDPVEALRTE